MSGEIGALADVVTGAAIARAVEPSAGEGQVSGGNCLNCRTALIGNHCHSCGQKAKVHRTLSAFWHDLVHSVFHFDGKIWHTLPLLAFKPGQLTRRYVHGERARFVSPLALFLFCVFFTYAIVSRAIPSYVELNAPVSAADAAKELASDRAEILKDIKELEQQKSEAIASKRPSAWIDGQIARNREALKMLEATAGTDVRKKAIAENKLAIEQRRADSMVASLEAELAAARKAGTPVQKLEDDLQAAQTGAKLMRTASGLMTKNGGEDDGEWNFTDLKFKGSNELNAVVRHAMENPQLVAYKLQSSAYKFSWALIPISVPFVWLLFFWRRQFKMFDHAVFVTYSLSFMMVLTSVGVLASRFPSISGPATAATIMIPPAHMFFQLRGAYGLTKFGALWRTALLTTFAVTALFLFAALIFALGLM